MNTEYLRNNYLERQDLRSEELALRFFGFPENLSFSEFNLLSPELRKQVILRNPILHTDAYNRTMEYVEKEDGLANAEYVLQFRKADKGYLIATGIQEVCQKIADIRITQDELDFAKDYYKNAGGVNYFNPEKWQKVIDEHQGRIPITIEGLRDGSAILPGDPILKVSGPNELVAHFEPYFHHIFYQTLVATNAHEIADKIGADRFIEVGLRGAETEEKHLMAVKAMYVGGGIKLTSSDMAVGYFPQFKLVGTLGHRYIQAYETEEAAFRKAIESLDAVTLLVDLNNSINGIDIALKLKEEYRNTGKKIWIRLDSGNVSEQAIYALIRQKEKGFEDPMLDKIIVEGIEHIDDMVDIDNAISQKGIDPKSFVMYGAGGLLVSENTQRCDASTGFKLSKIGQRPTMKFSDTPQKESIPGSPIIALWGRKRIIAQESEDFTSLFVTYYDQGQLLTKDDLANARINAKMSFEFIREDVAGKKNTQKSFETRRLINELKNIVFDGKVGDIHERN